MVIIYLVLLLLFCFYFHFYSSISFTLTFKLDLSCVAFVFLSRISGIAFYIILYLYLSRAIHCSKNVGNDHNFYSTFPVDMKTSFIFCVLFRLLFLKEKILEILLNRCLNLNCDLYFMKYCRAHNVLGTM